MLTNSINGVSDWLSNARLNLRSMFLGMEFEAAHSPTNEGASLWRDLADFITTDADKARLQRAVDQGIYETDRLTAQRDAVMHTAPDAIEEAHAADMDEWETLNQAVGGDLWDNPEKLAIMNALDLQMQDADWSEFHDAVVQAVNNPARAPVPEPVEEFAF